MIGDLLDRYGSRATIIVMSDHGFANFGRQFNLNSWLQSAAISARPDSVAPHDVDWSRTVPTGWESTAST